MALMRCVVTTVAIGMLFMNNTICAMEKAPGDPESTDWASWAADKGGRTLECVRSNAQILSLISALMHIPYIATVDSSNPKTIKACATLAAAATSLKVASIAAGHGQTMKILMWDAPKMLSYLLSIGYDTIRILDAPKVAYKNHVDGKKLNGFKITQSMQLVIEIILRAMAILSQRGASLAATEVKIVSGCASELADIISIWRLLGRYITYFYYTDKIEFNMTFQKKQDPLPEGPEEAEDEQAMVEVLEKELEALAQSLELQDQRENTPEVAVTA